MHDILLKIILSQWNKINGPHDFTSQLRIASHSLFSLCFWQLTLFILFLPILCWNIINRVIFLKFVYVKQNSYNNPINSKPTVPAVAAMISGDKSYFFRVGFFGLQDTLWDVTGRHYYKLCTIQGAIDFIFGAAQSLFEVIIINCLSSSS